MNHIKDIKDMLLGISIILVLIIIHLFIVDPLITDFIGVIGIIFILYGYLSKNTSE